MNGYVKTEPVIPATPKQTITLDLSVEEFAVLRHLQREYLGGTHDLRTRIETVFNAVERDLAEGNRTVLKGALFGARRRTTCDWLDIKTIAKAFDERT